MHTANGHVVEDPRWARNRTGWEPRFGEGDLKFDGEPPHLSHQTWMETKVDETWFGGITYSGR